jgi:hypothetical protein
MISACWREYPVVGFFVANLLCGKDEEDYVRPATYISNHSNDFDWNHEDITGLPPVKWRINTKYAKRLQEPKNHDDDHDDDTNSQRSVFGHPGFPPLFLFGFIWRNFVSGPGIATPSPFPLPPRGQEFFRNL